MLTISFSKNVASLVDSMCLTRPAHKFCKGLKRARPILRVFAAISTPWLRARLFQ